jgi:hypothetical protein
MARVRIARGKRRHGLAASDRPAEVTPPLPSDAVAGSEMDELTIERVDRSVGCPAEIEGFSRDRLEDGLDVGLGTADDAEDLAGCRLLRQRFAQFGFGVA